MSKRTETGWAILFSNENELYTGWCPGCDGFDIEYIENEGPEQVQ